VSKTEAGRPSDVPPPSRPPDADLGRHRKSRSRGRWRLPLLPLVIALVCVTGAGLLLYPSVAAWFTQYEQSQRIIDYSTGVYDLGAETLRQRLEEARAYNEAMAEGGAQIAANERLPLAIASDQAGAYSEQLRGDAEGLMARIKIPAISVDLPVYHGTSESVLRQGVGHLEGTALPVGGLATHAVLTAHRGLATAELFSNLDRVEEGDSFTIEVFGEVLTYRVTSTRVVQPADTETLFARKGADLVTLVTCTPLGVNSHRILVTGERVIPTPQNDRDSAGQRPEIPTFPWWTVVAAGVVGVAGLYVWLSGRPPRMS
jgi:sortase A